MRMCTEERAASTSAKMRGEEVRAFDPGLDGGRRRPREVECGVVRARPTARNECFRRRLRLSGCHGLGRRRPALTLRDPQHLAVDDNEQAAASRDAIPRPCAPLRATVVLASPLIVGGSYTQHRKALRHAACRLDSNRRRGRRSLLDMDRRRADQPQRDARPEQRVARPDRRSLRARLEPLDGSRLIDRSGRPARLRGRDGLDGCRQLGREPRRPRCDRELRAAPGRRGERRAGLRGGGPGAWSWCALRAERDVSHLAPACEKPCERRASLVEVGPSVSRCYVG